MTPHDLLTEIADVLEERLGRALAPVERTLAVVQVRQGATERALEACDDVRRELAALRERIAVAEIRPLVAGPPGRDGTDGAPGLSFGDLAIEQRGPRTIVVTAIRDGQVRELGVVTFPVELYCGVWTAGRTYEAGDSVTWGGSVWHCNAPTTTKPGTGVSAWTLKVKCGRDGKDGKGAP